ncbi:MAG: hypothetical protein Q9167_000692 [Letrouitia subvulpina]
MLRLYNESQPILLPRDSSPESRDPTGNNRTDRKRKYDEEQFSAKLGEPIDIQSLTAPKLYQKDSSLECLRLIPRLLLPRSAFSLVFLHPNRKSHHTPRPGLFSASIPILDESAAQENTWGLPMILVAEHELRDGLCAVETVRTGLYALSQLADWVTLQTLEGVTSLSPSQETRVNNPCLGEDQKQWWHFAAVEGVKTAATPQPKQPGPLDICDSKLCMNQLASAPTRSDLNVCERTLDQVCASSAPLADNPKVTSVDQKSSQQALLAHVETLDSIKSHYREALYLSKASLAYFAKGPLSRARASFTTDSGSLAGAERLVSYLRSLILGLSLLDKKYRESLPGIVNDLPLGYMSEDAVTGIISTLEKTSQKSKKDRVGKNGLYIGEETQIAQWWLSQSASLSPIDGLKPGVSAMKQLLLEQRARETQLQIILILEVFALEELKPATLAEDTLTSLDTTNTQPKKKNIKNPQDLNNLLEVLLDRLCIWQSMSADESKATADQSSTVLNKSTAQDPVADRLRDFCIDVVLPFYGARAPEKSQLVCKKLGGPIQSSKGRLPLGKAAIASQASLGSGAAMKRSVDRKSRGTLKRILTDEKSTSLRTKPSFSRAATESDLSMLKRNLSDPSLTVLPLNEVATRRAKRYSQREVDFTAVSQAAQARMKKKADVEQELQGAIAALRKPNPRMAVKELVEAADKRMAGSQANGLRPLHRRSLGQNIQVMATPSARRHKRKLVGIPSSLQGIDSDHEEMEGNLPSGMSQIPRAPEALVVNSVSRCIHEGLNPSVEQTPSRGPSKVSNLIIRHYSSLQASDPKGRASSSTDKVEQSLPLASSASDRSLKENFGLSEVFRTPTKQRPPLSGSQPGNPEHDVENTPIQDMQALSNTENPNATDPLIFPKGDRDEMSIYQRLGWDDDFNELM